MFGLGGKISGGQDLKSKISDRRLESKIKTRKSKILNKHFHCRGSLDLHLMYFPKVRPSKGDLFAILKVGPPRLRKDINCPKCRHQVEIFVRDCSWIQIGTAKSREVVTSHARRVVSDSCS